MNAKEISQIYNQIILKNEGARSVKFDLHIHTPASKDYLAPKHLSEEDTYLTILQEAQNSDIEIIAITDHNTFQGYNKLRSLLSSNQELQKRFSNLYILCGIEITCYSNHLLAIFDIDFSEEEQRRFLYDIGIESETEGTEDAMADELGPSALLRKIGEYKGISLLAHADAEKGFLYTLINKKGQEISFKGKSLAKIIRSPHLFGIQVVSDHGKSRIIDVLRNRDYIRSDRNLPFLSFSDSHGIICNGSYTGRSGKPTGTVYSVAKLSYNSFNAIKIALSDEYARIVKSENNQVLYPYIIGCAIRSDILKSADSKYTLFKFSPQMNCIIGSRGTGKSTLLGIIQDVLMYDLRDASAFYRKNYQDRYSTGIVFIYDTKNIYAIANDIYGKEFRCIYVKLKNSYNFRRVRKNNNFLNLFLTKVYEQGEINQYHNDSSKALNIIDDFIMWKKYDEYGDYINRSVQGTEDIRVLFERCMKQNKNLVEYIRSENLSNQYLKKYYEVTAAKDAITELRERFVEQINDILKNKVKLRITYEIDSEIYAFLTTIFPKQVARIAAKYYDYEVLIREFLIGIMEKSKIRPRFDFFALLITDQHDAIFSEYKIIKDNNNLQILKDIQNSMQPTELMFLLENGIELEYNVNSGIAKSKEVFRKNHQLSLGQNAVALLLIILTASQGYKDNRPLIMDQPEDDLDNSYIYNTLVEEFRRSKNNRQLLISTHNANIPVSGDAENIIVLKYNGEYGYIHKNGSLDDPEISRSVLEILEGGEQAMRSRNEKYRNIVKIVK